MSTVRIQFSTHIAVTFRTRQASGRLTRTVYAMSILKPAAGEIHTSPFSYAAHVLATSFGLNINTNARIISVASATHSRIVEDSRPVVTPAALPELPDLGTARGTAQSRRRALARKAAAEHVEPICIVCEQPGSQCACEPCGTFL